MDFLLRLTGIGAVTYGIGYGARSLYIMTRYPNSASAVESAVSAGMSIIMKSACLGSLVFFGIAFPMARALLRAYGKGDMNMLDTKDPVMVRLMITPMLSTLAIVTILYIWLS